MHRLQAVADVGQGAPDDDAHRVVDIGGLHLRAEVARDDVADRFRGQFTLLGGAHGLSVISGSGNIGTRAVGADGGRPAHVLEHVGGEDSVPGLEHPLVGLERRPAVAALR